MEIIKLKFQFKDLEIVQFASRFENQAHVRRRKVPFFGGGGWGNLCFLLVRF